MTTAMLIWWLSGVCIMVWDERANWTYEKDSSLVLLYLLLLLWPLGPLSPILLYYCHNDRVFDNISRPGNVFRRLKMKH